MLRVLIARLVIAAAAVCAVGGAAGVGLANYVESGSFHFYKQPRMSERGSAATDSAAPQQAFSDFGFEPGHAGTEAAR